jgi:hypothetical protein
MGSWGSRRIGMIVRTFLCPSVLSHSRFSWRDADQTLLFSFSLFFKSLHALRASVSRSTRNIPGGSLFPSSLLVPSRSWHPMLPRSRSASKVRDSLEHSSWPFPFATTDRQYFSLRLNRHVVRSKPDAELWKRAFWQFYVLDRSTSGRECLLSSSSRSALDYVDLSALPLDSPGTTVDATRRRVRLNRGFSILGENLWKLTYLTSSCCPIVSMSTTPLPSMTSSGTLATPRRRSSSQRTSPRSFQLSSLPSSCSLSTASKFSQPLYCHYFYSSERRS